MKGQRIGITIFGVIFLFVGIVWFVMIYKRCTEIKPPAAVQRIAPPQSETPQPKYRIVRNPHIKPHHVILFLAVVSVEMLCSALFIIGGFCLLRRYPTARAVALGALLLDLAYKFFTIQYMQFIALPLQQLSINRQNILLAYYTPDKSWASQLSLYSSGLQVFQPRGGIFVALYLLVVVMAIYFLTRPDIKVILRQVKVPNKKASAF